MAAFLGSLPPHPETQCRSCTTFRIPPLDGSLTHPQLYDFHGEHSANHRLFVYPDTDGGVNTILWSSASHAIRRSAQLVRDLLSWTSDMDDSPVVAILSSTDTISYATTVMGIMRAGYIPFPISTRNSPTAVAHLFEKTGVKHVFVGLEQAVQNLIADACNVLRSQCLSAIIPTTSPIPVFNYLYGETLKNVVEVQDVPYQRSDLNRRAFILHSSGSTSLPKAIYFTHRSLLQYSRSPFYGERDMTDRVFSLHSVPMFHAMGNIIMLCAASCGKVLAVPAPKAPPVILTSDAVILGAMATRVEYLLAVPSMVEAWSKNSDYVQWMATCDGVLYAGGPLNKERGDYLVSQGVRIINVYGATETGYVSAMFPAETGKDWEYFHFARFLTVKLEPQGNDQYELILVATELMQPNILNTSVDGLLAYSTSDLVELHPTKENLYRVVGRTDDQIIHSTGEKTNSLPLETMMNQDRHVKACVMFGSERLQAGILVEPTQEYTFDPSDEAKVAEFREKIWPTVLRINAFAPQHSRLFKEMILIAKPTKPFSYTPKGTARRRHMIKDYEEEINVLYSSLQLTSEIRPPVPPPLNWDIASTAAFVRRVVTQVMDRTVLDGSDIFQNGCDSLQAVYIRNSLLRAVRHTVGIDTCPAPDNFVYDNPTISQLSLFLHAMVLGTDLSQPAGASYAARIDAMRAMVAKYTADFPEREVDPKIKPPRGDIVLITGTTGRLGCHLLVQLAASLGVKRVYALNRCSKDKLPLRERQGVALLNSGLEVGVLDSDKVVLLQGDLTKPYFGVNKATYRKLHRSVTHIIHNAWHVDFVVTLSSLEPQVQAVRALVTSMGTLYGAPAGELVPESSTVPEYAVGTGYAESKWVSEQILLTGAEKKALNLLVVRLGQLCAGPNGVWNPREWFPSVVQSATTLGCFPDDTKLVNWIPLDIAAAALIEFRNASSPTNLVHLVHPRPISWRTLAAAISLEFNIPLVPFSVWLSRLEQYAAQSFASQQGEETEAAMITNIQAIHLLPVFRRISGKGEKGKMAFGQADMDVRLAKEMSQTLADPALRQLTIEDVQRWLTYWREVGLFSGF